MYRKLWLVFSMVVLPFSGCRCSRPESDHNLKSEQGGSSQDNLAAQKARSVTLAIWPQYITPELLQQFERETGIHVNVTNYSSNEELLAKLQAGATGYGVAVPSDCMVDVMVKLHLLEPIDLAKLPNAKGLDPKFLKQDFDPNNAHSLPYAWSVTGIAVNQDLYKAPIKGWKDLYEAPALAGRISVLDDVRETVGMALRVLGKDLNSTLEADLAQAKASLLTLRPRIKAFSSEPHDLLLQGETAAAAMFSPEALQARAKSNGRIAFILPEEGGARAIDNLVIPKGSQATDAAHQLMNFLLKPEVNAALVKGVFAGPVVTAAISLLPPELRNDKALFPPDEVLSRFAMIKDLGDATPLWERTWTEVKAAQ